MTSYNVGGVNFSRPFKIRRMSHFGFNVQNVDDGLDFYGRTLGFRVTDIGHLRDLADDVPEYVLDDRGIFMTHNTDHHTFLLAHTTLGSMFGDNAASNEITLSHFTWQVSSLAEVYNAFDYFGELGVEIRRAGRDMPGSNYHVYILDPDGHTVELCYGMEQIGINGTSKPLDYFYRRFQGRAPIPQMGDFDEMTEATARGAKMSDGFAIQDLGLEQSERYDVEGILLPRPFKVTNIGPMGLFVNDVDISVSFYKDVMGFIETERVTWKGHECVYLRHGHEHHSLKLYPKAARADLGLSKHTTCASVGLQLGSYQQLRNAVNLMRAQGLEFITLPQELNPGVDYCAHVMDKDGHCMQLYYYMEQIGWDGRPRPADQRREITEPWPETLDAMSDTYVDQPFLGPLG